MIYVKKKNNDELYHYGVKGMKWGVRKQLKRNFNNDKNSLQRKHLDEEWEKQDIHGYMDRIDAMDNAEKRRHRGYEDGDLYTPDWRNSKSKKVREYSRLTDYVYGDGGLEESVHAVANKRTAEALLKKYGGATWKEVKKNYRG